MNGYLFYRESGKMGTIKRKAVLGEAALLAVIAAMIILLQPDVAQAKKAAHSKTIKIKDASRGLLINKKEKRKLKLQSKPSGISSRELEWKSSKKSVVSVNQKGVIRGKKYGRAYIWPFLAAVLCCTGIPRKIYEAKKYSFIVTLGLVLVFWACAYCMYLGLDDPFLYYQF